METVVLGHVLNGLKNIEIVDDLEVSEQTANDYVSNIYTKWVLKTGLRWRAFS